MSQAFENKGVIVTGGASGIGFATAERFASAGAHVLITDWDEKRGAAAAERLSAQGLNAHFHHHDAGDEDSWRRVMDSAAKSLPPLAALVNNAYSGGNGFIETLTKRDLRASQRVNVEGAMLGMQLAANAMTSGGAIVNLASIVAFRGVADNASYAAAKASIVSLTQSAAVAYARRTPPIRVNAVAPGFIETPSLHLAIRAIRGAAEMDALTAELKRMADMSPLGRIGQPHEVANAIYFLASDEASFITGQCLTVDGGVLTGV